MNFPDKVTCYEESVLPHMVRIAKILRRDGELPVEDLLAKMKHVDVADFAEAMDCLFALRRIEVENGVVRYVG